MKNIKKWTSLLLALVMAFALAVPAFAADGEEDTSASNSVTVTLPGDDTILKDHNFFAYQIFKGDKSGTNGNVLSNVEWGDDVNSEAFLNVLKTSTDSVFEVDEEVDGEKTGNKVNMFVSCATAADVAEALGKHGGGFDGAVGRAFAKLALANLKTDVTGTELHSGENTLAAGYYLIVDKMELDPDETNTVLNAALLQVVGDSITVQVKTDLPTVEKKVKEDDKTTSPDLNTNNPYGAGYNDVADYDIGEDVPFKLIGTVPDMSRYATYSYKFVDTMSKGLDLNQNSIKIYYSDDKAGTNKVEITGITPKVTNNADGSTTIEIEFTDLKDTLKNTQNANYILVEYTAKLNKQAEVGLPGNPNEVYLEYSNEPDGTGTGKTETDKVIVFTYELDTKKVDGSDPTKPLEDAEFHLYKEVTVNGASKTLWANVDSDGKLIGWVEATGDAEYAGSTLTSDKDGLFKVIGLDDGTYYLKETKAPTGYNLLKDPIKLEITATTSNGQSWTSGNARDALTALKIRVDDAKDTNNAPVYGNGDLQEGSVSVDVKNNAGSTLPETGGIGTTIFYAVGGVLVVAAVVLLVTKKRMSTKD